MGMESNNGQEKERGNLQEESKNEISKVARPGYPAENPQAHEKIVQQIIDTYELDNPVDQMLANRAATQLMMLQYCQEQLKKYGLFYENIDKKGKVRLEMNQLSYFIKQLESEFRANIRMLKGNTKINTKQTENFAEWLDANSTEVKNDKT